ncbi:carboxymuconolactone decarboxylase family protein [Candidatus Hydrogenedentota bacterium]
MDNKTKELIAVGASITANCLPCLQFHAGKAREYGADEQEILDAIETGKMVRQGAAGKMERFIPTLLEGEAVATRAEDAGCGCS